MNPNLLHQLCHQGAQPELGKALAHLAGLAPSQQRELTLFVRSDRPLARRLLVQALNANFAQSQPPVTSVSGAIDTLGFDKVKATVLGLFLSRGLLSSSQEELQTALSAGLLARQISDAPQAATQVILQHLGPILLAAQAPARHAEIRSLCAAGRYSADAAAQMILGAPLQQVSDAVLRAWQLPVDPASEPLARFCLATSRALSLHAMQVQDLDIEGLLARHGTGLGLDAATVRAACHLVRRESEQMLIALGLPKRECRPELALPEPDLLAFASLGQQPAPSAPSERLRQTIADMQAARRRGARLGEQLNLALSGLHQALGTRFAVLCVKDAQAGQFRGRIALGDDSAKRRDAFVVPDRAGRNLFQLALERGDDIAISDLEDPTVKGLLPDWHASVLPRARSAMILPLVVGRARLGFIYADGEHKAPLPAEQETRLIRALKAEMLAAMAA